jgi:predicted site-specific integrase-resolvase
MSVNHQLVAVGHAAVVLGVTPKTIRRYLADGTLDGCVLPSGHHRVTLESIERVRFVRANDE